MTNSSSTLTVELRSLQAALTRYVYPVWLTFGLIGCLLNLFVFSRRKLRSTTCSICKSRGRRMLELNAFVSLPDFFVASVDHILTLIIGIVPALYGLDHPNPVITDLWFCRVRGFLFQISLMISRWCVAFACINRCVLSFDRMYLRSFTTAKFTYRVILVTILFWTLVSIHRLIFFEIGENMCWILTNVGAGLFQSVYVILGGGILPSTIMAICACVIRRNIQRKNKRRVQWAARAVRRHRMDHQMHQLLFIQVISYIIFILPQMGNVVFNTVSITIPNRSREHFAVEGFLNFFAELMLYLFPVTSFYLYTLTSRTFRSELVKFLHKTFKRSVRVGTTTDLSVVILQKPWRSTGINKSVKNCRKYLLTK